MDYNFVSEDFVSHPLIEADRLAGKLRVVCALDWNVKAPVIMELQWVSFNGKMVQVVED